MEMKGKRWQNIAVTGDLLTAELLRDEGKESVKCKIRVGCPTCYLTLCVILKITILTFKF